MTACESEIRRPPRLAGGDPRSGVRRPGAVRNCTRQAFIDTVGKMRSQIAPEDPRTGPSPGPAAGGGGLPGRPASYGAAAKKQMMSQHPAIQLNLSGGEGVTSPGGAVPNQVA